MSRPCRRRSSRARTIPLLTLPGFRVGKNGVEKVDDLALRGKAGNSELEVNAVGRVMRELARTEGTPGQDLALTFDMELQRLAMERLAAERSAAAVVMDVHTGEVLVMASSPSFDPNAFARGLTPEEWQALAGDDRSPLTNKAIAGPYAPGSTFKPVVARRPPRWPASAPTTACSAAASSTLGNTRFHCWKHDGHGWLDMVGGIENSCDVLFLRPGAPGGHRRHRRRGREAAGSATGWASPFRARRRG